MFKSLTQKFRAMGSLANLFKEAERIALAEGQVEPGAEHMVMAALTMPDDDSARRVLSLQGAFWDAVGQQYSDALRSVGVEAPALVHQDNTATIALKPRGLYKSSESTKDLLDAVTASNKLAGKTAFSAAEFILGATNPKFGVVARAFDRLGIDREELAAAARTEIAKHNSN